MFCYKEQTKNMRGGEVALHDMGSVRRGWHGGEKTRAANGFGLGVEAIDERCGGLARAAVHEILAAGHDDAASAAGFALALADRASLADLDEGFGRDLFGRPRTAERGAVCWIAQDFLGREAGGLHPPGLVGFGIDPARVTLVKVRDMADGLRAADEAARCRGLGAVVLAMRGDGPVGRVGGGPRDWDLTASRRLALAAAASGVTLFVVRVAAGAVASAASSRWRVQSAPSRPAPANAPGNPAFRVALLRHASRGMGSEWSVEWNRAYRAFDLVSEVRGAASPRPVASLPADRSAAADFRRSA